MFDLLKFDRARPQEAEAEAARRGWEPLAPEPDLTKFDPMAEPQWSLAMAMAWIATRSVDAVRSSWNKYRAKCWVWRRSEWRDGPQGEVIKGWLLCDIEPATSLGIELLYIVEQMKEDGHEPIMTVDEARGALWDALGQSLLPATGLASIGRERVSIPAADWQNLLPRSERRDEVGRQGLRADYIDPLVPAKAVTHMWPARRERSALPPLMTPEGDGFMPLYCAARWIASRGGARDFDAEDASIWQVAFSDLLAAISSDKVRVVGLRAGERDLVPGHKFAGCLVDYPHTDAPMDLLTSNNVYLRSYPYLDDLHWRNGFDDALVNRRGVLWTQLLVDRSDVRRHWPYELASPTNAGWPGRPTSKHLVMLELERRSTAGELQPTVTEEAKSLWQWVKAAHPEFPPGTAKTIENYIRDRYRKLRP